MMIRPLAVHFSNCSEFLSSENTRQRQLLNWSDRLKIALGSAQGLAYLHHECSPKVVHCNIKSSNILLDENMEPHISDFGLAKLLVDEEAHVTTVVAGTFGYLAPGMYLLFSTSGYLQVTWLSLLLGFWVQSDHIRSWYLGSYN